MEEINKFLNKVHNSDYFLVTSKIPDKSVDLILVDPPYCINYKDWDKIDFVSFTKQWTSECFRVLKDNGTMWSFMGYQNILEFIPLLREVGFNVHLENWVVWARQKGRSSSKHLKSMREDIFHCTKGDNKFTWNPIKMLKEVVCPYVKDGKPRGWFINEEGKRVRWTGLGNVMCYTAPSYNSLSDKQIHSAQKPTMLIERLMLLSSNENDIILDPFCGSGTTCVVAKALKRKWIGIELDKEFYNSAISRLRTIEQKKLKH